MAYDDVLTRNEDSELAVRVVETTGDNPASSYDDVYTRDNNGKLAVRVVGSGGGGGDSHNLGWYATPQALSEAHATATAGDWAIVGSTDTVWIWDTDTSAWVDSDTKGQVTSVNGQTGAVTVQETLVSGTNIKTVDGNSLLGSGNLELSTYLTYPAGWTTNSTTKAFCDSIAADSSAVKGKAYLGEVTCSDLPSGMLNAEVVVEIMDGTTAQDKVIVLSLKSGNVAPYAWQYVYWDNGTNVSGWKTWQETLVSGTNIKTINNNSILGSGNLDIDGLPSQTGQSGKFLTTDGTDASWSPLATVATTGSYNDLEDQPDIPSEATQVGAVPEFGSMPTADAEYENIIVQYSGATTSTYTNGYFYRCDSTLVSAASATISQTVGSSLSDLAVVAADFESNYPDSGTYDFVFDGADWYYDEDTVDLTSLGITYTGTPDADDTIEVVFTATEYSYAWNRVDVQPGGSSYTAGTGIDITSGTISTTIPLYMSNVGTYGDSSIGLNTLVYPSKRASIFIGEYSGAGGTAVQVQSAICIGNSTSGSSYSVVIGQSAGASSTAGHNICIGHYAMVGGSQTQYAIQLGSMGTTTSNSDSNTFKVANANGNFEMMSADGTVPTDRFTTTPSADGTYVPTLTISSGVATRTWSAPSGGSPTTTTVTLAVNDWSNNSQTVNVSGVTASNLVQVAPAPSSNSDYVSGGVLCTAQGTGTLTFTCTTTPTNAITVNVVIFG